MYRLLLVTKDAEVREAFAGIPELNRLMFEPVTILDSVEEAIQGLRGGRADAIGSTLDGPEQNTLLDHLANHHPCLPIFRTHRRGEDLRGELALVREFLDQLHADISDSDTDADLTIARLQNELVHKLLEERIPSRDELESRLMLTRSPLSPEHPCFLFEFSLPEGEQYLESRWRHGFERLDLSLRANFFGRIQGPLYCGAALISAERLRVIACATGNLSESDIDLLSRSVHDQVLSTARQVKDYMDLELVCTEFRVLDSLAALIP